MIVYRLQDSEGHGPFYYQSSLFGFIRNHAEPQEMAKAGKASHSLEKVNDWLGAENCVFAWNCLYLMADFMRFPINADNAGFRVVVFDVADDSIVFDDGQVLFDRSTAVIKDSFLLTRILDHIFNQCS